MTTDDWQPLLRSGAIEPARRLLGVIPRPSAVPPIEPGQGLVLFDRTGRALVDATPGELLWGSVTSYAVVDLAHRRMTFEFPRAIQNVVGAFDVAVSLEVWVKDWAGAAQAGTVGVRSLVEPRVGRLVRRETHRIARQLESSDTLVLLDARVKAEQHLEDELQDLGTADLDTSGQSLLGSWLAIQVVSVAVTADPSTQAHIDELQHLARGRSTAEAHETLTKEADTRTLNRVTRLQAVADQLRDDPTRARIVNALMQDSQAAIDGVLVELNAASAERAAVSRTFLQHLFENDFIDDTSPHGRQLIDAIQRTALRAIEDQSTSNDVPTPALVGSTLEGPVDVGPQGSAHGDLGSEPPADHEWDR